MMVRRCVLGGTTAVLALACTPLEADSNEPEQQTPVSEVAETPAEVSSDVRIPDPKPKAEGSLTVEVLPRFPFVLQGQSGRMDVMVRVRAVEVPGEERPPLDLALIVDRSGSMAGDKLAAAKQAALETLRELDDDDLITFISYDDLVTVHSRRQKVAKSGATKRAMMAMTDGGGTALGPALADGLDLLRKAKRGEDVMAHVMLLSDGMANEGESRPEVLAQWTSAAHAGGVSVSTLGVGLDYNEDLMTKLADAGGGRYHFIEDSDKVAEVVAEEFAGLSSTVARNTTLSVAAEAGLEVEKIPGYPNTVDGGEVTAKVGSLTAGRKRELLVQMDYQAPKDQAMPLGTFTLRFRDTLADGVEREITLRPAVTVTADPKLVEDNENYAVTVRAYEFDVAATMQEATEAVDRGRYDDARSLLRTKREELKKQATQNPDLGLDGMVTELDEAEQKVGDAERSLQQRKLYKKSFKSKAYKRSKK
jgi:Ca-activated chloride channel family protein